MQPQGKPWAFERKMLKRSGCHKVRGSGMNSPITARVGSRPPRVSIDLNFPVENGTKGHFSSLRPCVPSVVFLCISIGSIGIRFQKLAKKKSP